MQKIALIVRSQPADWISCRSISANLAESYRMATEDCSVEIVDLPARASSYHMCRVASRLIKSQFNKLIFIEHDPNPCPLINALFEIDPDFRPELIFHAFGDFILNAPIWLSIEKLLEVYPVQFVCASLKQEKLLRSLIVGNLNQMTTIPFPVSVADYYASETLRNDFRSEQKWGKDKSIFLYSGRLSLQKNIFSLLRAFESYQRQIDPDALLCLAGPVDDLGIPYLGKLSPQSLMSYDIQNLIAEIFGDRRSCVIYLGDLDSKQLNKVYNASDVFCSLSTHNDEDYGMAPAEALCTGLFTILSDWGGYSQFQTFAPQNSTLVPVQFQPKRVVPSILQATKAMALAPESYSPAHRKEQALEFQARISKEAISRLISKNLKQPNRHKGINFTPLFKKIAQSFLVQPKAPFSVGENYSQLYQEVYDVYRN